MIDLMKSTVVLDIGLLNLMKKVTDMACNRDDMWATDTGLSTPAPSPSPDAIASRRRETEIVDNANRRAQEALTRHKECLCHIDLPWALLIITALCKCRERWSGIDPTLPRGISLLKIFDTILDGKDPDDVPYDRQTAIYHDIREERARQDNLYSWSNCDDHRKAHLLTTQAKKTANYSVLPTHQGRKLQQELIETAAIAIRWLEELQTFSRF